MTYDQVLGESLKGEHFLDLFETYDVEVVYSYDRNDEGFEDRYYAKIPEMGLEFFFDKGQRLETLFLKNIEHNGYNPFAGKDPRDIPFNTAQGAVEWAKEGSIEFTRQKAKTDSVVGAIPEWVKFKYGSYSAHYQFGAAGVELVTLMRENA